MPVLSGCFAHAAEYQESSKNQYCRTISNGPAKKLCRHRILFSLSFSGPALQYRSASLLCEP